MIRVAFLALVVAGCTDVGVEQTGQVEQYDLRSSCMNCQNSPVIATYRSYEFNKLGAPNAEGLRINRFYLASGQPVALDVQRGRFIGRQTGGATHTGSALVGAIIDVIGTKPGDRFAVKIEEVRTIASVARLPPSGATASIEIYKLTWNTWGGAWPPPVNYSVVCRDLPAENDSLGMPAEFATVFEGDRIGASSFSIVGHDTNWFNVGCSGHLLAKMALTSHTYAAMSQGFVTTQGERTTMIKVLSADYCGRGIPFTAPGTPVTWADDRGWLQLAMPNAGFEAKWGPTGAYCLNEARCDVNHTDACEEDYPLSGPSVRELVTSMCGLPMCGAGAPHLVSANL